MEPRAALSLLPDEFIPRTREFFCFFILVASSAQKWRQCIQSYSVSVLKKDPGERPSVSNADVQPAEVSEAVSILTDPFENPYDI